jgi:hypothetical protein
MPPYLTVHLQHPFANPDSRLDDLAAKLLPAEARLTAYSEHLLVAHL